MLFLVVLSTLADDEAFVVVQVEKKNVVLTPDLLRGKKPCWEKKCPQLVALLVYVQMHNSFDLKFMCLCLGKKNQTVPNACAHEWKHPICIQKDMQD